MRDTRGPQDLSGGGGSINTHTHTHTHTHTLSLKKVLMHKIERKSEAKRRKKIRQQMVSLANDRPKCPELISWNRRGRTSTSLWLTEKEKEKARPGGNKKR